MFAVKFSRCLVLMGLGILGLAWGLLFGSLVEAILVYIFRPSAARFIPSFKGLKPIFKFGFYSSMTNLLARFDANAPDLVIGKLGTTAQVAFFSRGVGFYQFITTLIFVSNPVEPSSKRSVMFWAASRNLLSHSRVEYCVK